MYWSTVLIPIICLSLCIIAFLHFRLFVTSSFMESSYFYLALLLCYFVLDCHFSSFVGCTTN